MLANHWSPSLLPAVHTQMLWRADYWDLAATVSAVLTKLETGAKQQLTLQHAALLSAMPPLQCQAHSSSKAGSEAGTSAARPPAAAPAARVQGVIDTLLLRHLRCASTIAADAALLARFTQLPLALVTRWVELDTYKVDSGNTLAVLFTAWHDAQPEPPSDEQCQQLSALLPLAAVSLMFHAQALPHLRWSREPKDALVAHIHAETCGDADAQAQWRIDAGGLGVARRATQSSKVGTWYVQARELASLWQSKRHRVAQLDYAGYTLDITLTLTHTQNSSSTAPAPGTAMTLGVEASVGWHDALTAGVGSTPLSAPREVLHGAVTVVQGTEGYSHSFHAKQWPVHCSALASASGVPCTIATREALVPSASGVLKVGFRVGKAPCNVPLITPTRSSFPTAKEEFIRRVLGPLPPHLDENFLAVAEVVVRERDRNSRLAPGPLPLQRPVTNAAWARQAAAPAAGPAGRRQGAPAPAAAPGARLAAAAARAARRRSAVILSDSD